MAARKRSVREERDGQETDGDLSRVPVQARDTLFKMRVRAAAQNYADQLRVPNRELVEMKKLKITMELELEACPFCGNTTDFEISQNDAQDCYWITCEDCGADSGSEDTPIEAASNWNRRQKPRDET